MPKPLAVPWSPNGTSLIERMCRLFRINRLTLAKHCFCYIGLLPVFVIYWVLRLEPIARTFILSFYDWHLIRPLKPFVGLAGL